MNKKITTLVLSLLYSLHFLAQDLPVDLEKNSDFVKLKERVVSIEEDVDGNSKAVKDFLSRLDKLSKELKTKTKIDIESEQMQLENQRKLIYASSDFVGAILNTFNSIELSIKQSAFSGKILSLNNPTSKELGFSLESVIEENIKNRIYKGVKDGDTKAEKLNSFVNTLINNPLTQIARSLVPSLSSVISFVSSISFGDKKIPEKNIKDFVESLAKYVKFYEELSNANTDFLTNLDQLKIRRSAVEMLFKNYVIDKIEIFYDNSDNNENEIKSFREKSLKDIVNAKYTNTKIEKRLAVLGSNKQDGASKFLKFPATTVSQAVFINDEIEALSNQYLKLHKDYHDNIMTILENSRSLDKAVQKEIDDKKETLTLAYKDWKESFINAVNIEQNKEYLKNLSLISTTIW